MTHRGTYLAGLTALSAPLLLLALGAARRGDLLAWLKEPALVASNWVYMASPALLAMLVALVVRSARRRFLPAALWTLAVLVVTFQTWVWWAVPARESALFWVLYHPLCLVTVAAVGLASAVRDFAKRPSAAQRARD